MRVPSKTEGSAIRRVMNIVPNPRSGLLLGFLPLVLIAAIYLLASAERRAANPNDKLLPPVAEMADTVRRLATEPDRRTEEIVLWTDTAASLQRLAIGLGVATLSGLAFGLALGVLPMVNATLGTLVAIISMIPPMAVLPIFSVSRRVSFAIWRWRFRACPGSN